MMNYIKESIYLSYGNTHTIGYTHAARDGYSHKYVYLALIERRQYMPKRNKLGCERQSVIQQDETIENVQKKAKGQK